MPELPEVETIVKQLDKVLQGKVIKNVEVLREKSFKGEIKDLVERKIKKVGRKSKMVVMEFVELKKVVLIHLKMTGQLIYIDSRLRGNDGRRIVGGHPTTDWVGELPGKHTRVIINFKNGSRLFFNDMRAFGWMKIGDVPRLPPDVVDKEFTLQLFKELVSGSKRAIKLVLMDQKKIGGIGNIYANDGLFLAKIDPKKMASSLDNNEIERLHKAIKKVINKGILLAGKYQNYFLVYGREGEKCKRCGEEIKKFKLGGRGTYWCLKCQK
ncbi:hypothetical protein KJ953_00295 [Patescibacteria group bacterium]|nr:hypothetical protein [Patescibacteria group bacterium]MBU1256553.1 hypothetical protein [Patescibacteria group bacterium]MBU1457573.1 hypothetical protein [Patescibacteria group bacterium]